MEIFTFLKGLVNKVVPLHLVLGRHAESLGNLLRRLMREGQEIPEELKHFLDIPDWQLPLSEDGILQAKATGKWIRENFDFTFDAAMVSAMIRTRQTAGHYGLGLRWFMNQRIMERDHGLDNYLKEEDRRTETLKRWGDPLFHRPGKGTGQAIFEISDSTLWFFSALHREHSDHSVIAVCHGERMWDIMREIEKLTPEAFAMRMNDPLWEIHNCQLVHYTRVNPIDSSDIRKRYDWVRSFCPSHIKSDGSFPDTGWVEIHRPRFSDADLLAGVEPYLP